MEKTYTIGIDMGGTNTDIGLVAENGTIVARHTMPTKSHTCLESFIDDITTVIKDMMSRQGGSLKGIGMGAPCGDYYTGCITHAANLDMGETLNMREAFDHRFTQPFVLDNDANAAAYGELIYGGAQNMEHFIVFTLGTGVGSGIVIDRHLVHGATGCAGELGHSILVPDGRPCGCGRQGCLETYTSASGIVKTFCELRYEMGVASSSITVPNDAVSCKMVGDAASAGDIVALATFEKTGYWLGIAMANAVCFNSPEAVFLMGGPTQVGEPLLAPLRTSFDQHLLSLYKGSCQVRLSALNNNDAAILGAAALATIPQ